MEDNKAKGKFTNTIKKIFSPTVIQTVVISGAIIGGSLIIAEAIKNQPNVKVDIF
jgi:hypothetical protein